MNSSVLSTFDNVGGIFFFFMVLILINFFSIWSGERAGKLVIWGFLGSLVT